MRPDFELTIGQEVFRRGGGTKVIRLEVVRNMGLPIDSLSASLDASDHALDLEKDDEVSLSIGYEGELKKVFHGYLDEIHFEMGSMDADALGCSRKMLNMRKSMVFERQSAGAIATALVQEAGLKVKVAEEGLRFPYYAVDSNRNLYEHLLLLASRCNFDVYTDEEGDVVFKGFRPEETHEMRFGRDAVSMILSKRAGHYQSVKVVGESPAGSMGAEKYHWLTQDSPVGVDGQGEKQAVVVDRSVRDSYGCQEVAKAIRARMAYNQELQIETVGRAEVSLGHALELTGFRGEINGLYEVIGLSHLISKKQGFLSRFRCRRAG